MADWLAPHYQELSSKALVATRVEALWRFASPQPCEQRILPMGAWICGP